MQNVLITGAAERTNNTDGSTFVALIVENEGATAQLVRSASGNVYMRRPPSASVPSPDLTLEEAEGMVGDVIPGQVVRVECDPYTWTNDAGEEREVSHRWELQLPGEGSTEASAKVADKPVAAEA